MLYEYRRYSVVPGKRQALAERMAAVTLPLWKRHGIRPAGFWEPVIGLSNELHYILCWNDMAEREIRWNAFQVDPEWVSKRDRSEEHGPLVAKVFNELWIPDTVFTAEMNNWQQESPLSRGVQLAMK